MPHLIDSPAGPIASGNLSSVQVANKQSTTTTTTATATTNNAADNDQHTNTTTPTTPPVVSDSTSAMSEFRTQVSSNVLSLLSRINISNSAPVAPAAASVSVVDESAPIAPALDSNVQFIKSRAELNEPIPLPVVHSVSRTTPPPATAASKKAAADAARIQRLKSLSSSAATEAAIKSTDEALAQLQSAVDAMDFYGGRQPMRTEHLRVAMRKKQVSIKSTEQRDEAKAFLARAKNPSWFERLKKSVSETLSLSSSSNSNKVDSEQKSFKLEWPTK